MSPPTVADVARGLSTIPRWTARTILDRVGLRWSVLQHSLVCGAVASGDGNPVLSAYALLHDAEEILTGDVPMPYKTDAQSELGREVRAEILRGLGLPRPSDGVWERVKEIDMAVQEAERWVLLSPAEYAGRPFPDLKITGEVWGLLDLDVRAGIELFTDVVGEILRDPRVRSLVSRV
jgi:hypothetical protein